jgi:hypothetical protein
LTNVWISIRPRGFDPVPRVPFSCRLAPELMSAFDL